jgi:hypothetical protein
MFPNSPRFNIGPSPITSSEETNSSSSSDDTPVSVTRKEHILSDDCIHVIFQYENYLCIIFNNGSMVQQNLYNHQNIEVNGVKMFEDELSNNSKILKLMGLTANDQKKLSEALVAFYIPKK